MQVLRIDLNESLSPVIKPITIRLGLANVVHLRWTMKQLYVRNVFLHGNPTKKIYMEQPSASKILSIQIMFVNYKALYSLKQEPRAWFECLSNALIVVSFHVSNVDTSLLFLMKSLQLFLY